LFSDLQIYKTTITFLQFSIAVSIFHLTVKGLTPLDRVGVWRFVFLCAGAEHVVLGESPSGSIPWFLTEENTSRLATSSLPLQGSHQREHEPSPSTKKISGAFTTPSRSISGAVAGEISPTSTRFLMTNLISLHLHYSSFASHFHLPHFTNLPVLFAPLFCSPFSWLFSSRYYE
jgi:hypothetical protein